jgi:hypothetical protein
MIIHTPFYHILQFIFLKWEYISVLKLTKQNIPSFESIKNKWKKKPIQISVNASNKWNTDVTRSCTIILCTTLCDQVCQWLAIGRWLYSGPPVSSTNKTDHHDITEILLKVVSSTIKQTNKQTMLIFDIGIVPTVWCFLFFFFFFYITAKINLKITLCHI